MFPETTELGQIKQFEPIKTPGIKEQWTPVLVFSPIMQPKDVRPVLIFSSLTADFISPLSILTLAVIVPAPSRQPLPR